MKGFLLVVRRVAEFLWFHSLFVFGPSQAFSNREAKESDDPQHPLPGLDDLVDLSSSLEKFHDDTRRTERVKNAGSGVRAFLIRK